MARTRLIKPAFFANEDLADVSMAARLLYIGLWTIADREGRLEDRPKRIKGELFRYEDVNIDHALDELSMQGFIVRYEAEGRAYICLPTFVKHQSPHKNEPESEIPPPPDSESGDSRNVASNSGNVASTRVSRARADTLTLNQIPSPDTVGGAQDAPVPLARKRARPFTDTSREQMRAKWGDQLPAVDDEINLALAHKNAGKYTDLEAYVNNWLRRASEWRAERMQDNGRGTNQRRGTGAPRISDGSDWDAALAERDRLPPRKVGRVHAV